MNQIKYRFNRKDGIIYRDEGNDKLLQVGNDLRMIIVEASKPFWDKPFEHLSAQFWVNLRFIDSHGDYCFAMLNDGTTDALRPWLEYKDLVESKGFELFDVITTISFEQVESQNKWYDYQFSGVPGKPRMRDRIRTIISNAQSIYAILE
jgi:hypothetical protein